tara:strand:- start:148 stop:1509 length:1362 start_codon:yes stop_codon:yes gene_type:complete
LSSNKNYLADVPNYILPLVNMDHPNQSIFLIENNKFKIKTVKEEVIVLGNIEFKWFPLAGVYFEGKTEYLTDLGRETDNLDILTENDELLGKGFVTREGMESNEFYIKGVFALDCILGDPTIPVNEVRFVIPNMIGFHGSGIKDDTMGYSGRISLKLDDKEIILDKLPDFSERIEELKKVGGYHITYSGKITFKHSITLKDLEQEKEILKHFLQILSGKHISGLFFMGIFKDENVWRHFRSDSIEPYHHRGSSCFPTFLKKEDIDSLSTLYGNIEKFWKEEDQKTMIKLAAGWYLEANTKPYYQFDTSVIISQSALEMFYNWLLVEKEKIIRGKTNLSAANKIRLLIARIGLKNEVPEKFVELQKFLSDNKSNNEEDAVDAIVLYRNAIVHGEFEKRIKLQNFTPIFKREAMQLSIWYLELCILYVLGYEGKYRNRTKLYGSEVLPWNTEKNI